MKKKDRLIKPREAGVLLGLTPRTVVKWVKKGKLRGKKLGRVWRVQESSVLEMMED